MRDKWWLWTLSVLRRKQGRIVFKWSTQCILKVWKKFTWIKALRFIHQWRPHGRVTFANRKIYTMFNAKQLHPFVINCCDVGKVTKKLRFCFSVATWGNFIIEQMAATHWLEESTDYDTTRVKVCVRLELAGNLDLWTLIFEVPVVSMWFEEESLTIWKDTTVLSFMTRTRNIGHPS